MLQAFRRWRRERVLKREGFDEARWGAVLRRYPFTRVLSREEGRRLGEFATLFLHEKNLVGAGGLKLRDEMRMSIAAQACMLILNLDLDYYRGWSEIIVYPDEFVAEYEYVDEVGVAHRVSQPMSGESWLEGPVILSWADAKMRGGEGAYNVVLHEFAHKLDMLNGQANGFPPLHPGMNLEGWTGAFSAAYEDLRARVERQEHTVLDPYAAESPSEFFAVMSEAFFETPRTVLEEYPDVYGQLAAFYRQDTAARLKRAGDSRRERAEAR